jgi:hypothetical protein
VASTRPQHAPARKAFSLAPYRYADARAIADALGLAEFRAPKVGGGRHGLPGCRYSGSHCCVHPTGSVPSRPHGVVHAFT